MWWRYLVVGAAFLIGSLLVSAIGVARERRRARRRDAILCKLLGVSHSGLELAAACRIPRSSIYRLLSELIDDGLVVEGGAKLRTKLVGLDGRPLPPQSPMPGRKEYSLTREGAQMAAALLALYAVANRHLRVVPKPTDIN